MLRFLISATMLVSFYTAQAQVATLTNAILYHDEGNLPKAKEEIDKAVLNEKTIVMPKAWFYKGVIYKEIFQSTAPHIKSLDADALPHAFEAYNKAIALEKPAGEFTRKSKEGLEEIWTLSINSGITYYHQSSFTKAIAEYERAQAIKPADTTAFLYALYAANEMKNDTLVEKYAANLLALNYSSPFIYYNRIVGLANRNQLDSAIALSAKAVQKFPADQNLRRQELVLLINRGAAYDQVPDRKNAMICYKKALLIDSTNYIANYNLMINTFNQAKDVERVIIKNDAERMKQDTTYVPNRSPDPNRVELREKLATCHTYCNRILYKGRNEEEKKNIQNVMRDMNFLKTRYLD